MGSDHPHRALAEKLAADLIDAPYVLRQTAVDAILAAFDDVTGPLIEPLTKSDNPEIAEAVRVEPDYVLWDRAAFEAQQKLQHGWRAERDAERARREQAERERDEAREKARISDAGYDDMRETATNLVARAEAAEAECARLREYASQALADVREVIGKDAWKAMMRHYEASAALSPTVPPAGDTP